MVDIESQIFSTVRTAVMLVNANCSISSEYIPVPSQMPHISIYEENSYSYNNTFSSAGVQHDVVTYTVNVYSNKADGKKAECKGLMKVVDTAMLNMGFMRNECMPITIPNSDFTIYRMVAKYQAIVGKDNKIYRR